MAETPTLIISREEFQKISTLASQVHTETGELLEEELGRAQLVEDNALPADVVRMNSEVCFMDLDTKKEQTYILVYPQDADVEQKKISILAPMGAALIGLREGQEIDWRVSETKKRRIKVISVKQLAEEKEST